MDIKTLLHRKIAWPISIYLYVRLLHVLLSLFMALTALDFLSGNSGMAWKLGIFIVAVATGLTCVEPSVKNRVILLLTLIFQIFVVIITFELRMHPIFVIGIGTAVGISPQLIQIATSRQT